MGAISLSLFKTFRSITGTSQDALLQLYVDGANAFVENYTGKKFDSIEYTELIDGNAQLQIMTKNKPITAIDSIEINTGTIATPTRVSIEDEYSFQPYMIQLTRPLSRGLSNYKIVYTAGYDPVPGDIVLATLKIANWMMDGSDSVSKETVGGDSIEYKVENSELKSILGQYRNVY